MRRRAEVALAVLAAVGGDLLVELHFEYAVLQFWIEGTKTGIRITFIQWSACVVHVHIEVRYRFAEIAGPQLFILNVFLATR